MMEDSHLEADYEDRQNGGIDVYDQSIEGIEPPRRSRRRGDNIPPVSAYAHWGEEAYAMWYAENRYDMDYADEVIESDDWEHGDPWD